MSESSKNLMIPAVLLGLGVAVVAYVAVGGAPSEGQGGWASAADERVVIEHLQLGAEQSAGQFELVAYVRNNGDRPVSRLSLRSAALDCPGAAEIDKCEVIGEDEIVAEVDLPANQTQIVRTPFRVPESLEPGHRLNWSFALEKVAFAD